jgi:hypothetical protein
LLQTLILSRPELLITPRYSHDTKELCPRCEPTAAFQLADPNRIVSLLGYCYLTFGLLESIRRVLVVKRQVTVQEPSRMPGSGWVPIRAHQPCDQHRKVEDAENGFDHRK